MEKKDVVTLANFSREYETQHGHFFVHSISFSNGDSGEYSSKSKEQTKFVVGQEADYTIDASNPAYAAKIKPVSTYVGGGGSNGQAEPGRQNSIQRQTALKIASECVDINKHGIDALFTVADRFALWLNDAPQPTPVTPQQPETLVDTTEQTPDKLPF